MRRRGLDASAIELDEAEVKVGAGGDDGIRPDDEDQSNPVLRKCSLQFFLGVIAGYFRRMINKTQRLARAEGT